MTMMIDYWLFLHCGGGWRGGGRLIKSWFNVEVVNEHKLVEMICTQPPLDVCGIVKNCCCFCLRCGLLGGGKGLDACVAGGRWDGRQWQSQWWLFEKKRGWTREKERGNWKMSLFFHAVLFCYCFLAYLFQCRSIDFLSRSSQLLDGFLLQDFSSSCPNLVITFLLSNYSARVNCGIELYLELVWDRFVNCLSSSLLISYWLLRFVFAS